MNKYDQPHTLSKEETLNVLSGNHSTDEKVNAIVGAIHGIDDSAWLMQLCLDNIDNKDAWVAGAAINGLGDIARIFRQMDLTLVLGRLRALQSKRKDLACKIQDAIDDIETFVG